MLRPPVANCVFAAALCFTAGTATAGILDGQTLVGSSLIPNGTTETIYNNLTLDNADVEVRGLMSFLGTNTILGDGRITLIDTGDIRYNRDSSPNVIPGHQLNISSGIEIVGMRDGGSGTPHITFNSSNTFNPDLLVNSGIIAAEGDPADLNADLLLSPLLFTNQNLVTARDGGHMRLFMRDGWQNLGTFRAEDGGTVALAGTIHTATLGIIEAQGSGKFLLDGTLENAGQTLTLDESTGSMQLVHSQVIINGGTIKGVDGARLYSQSTTRRLFRMELHDGVTFDIDVDIVGSTADIHVHGGVTINERFSFDGDELIFFGDPATGSTLNGTGVLELHDRLQFMHPLTIAAETTVRGGHPNATIATNTADTLLNLGTIDALVGDQLKINATLDQQGLIVADKGSIQLLGNTHNTGQITAINDGSVRFDRGQQAGNVDVQNGGFFSFFGGTNTVDGVVSATNGGVVQIASNLQNDGAIQINNGFLWLNGGAITGNDAVVTDSTVVFSDDQTTGSLSNVPRTNSGSGLYLGTLDNTGQILTLTADRSTQWTLFDGSIIQGGSIDSPDNTPLRLGTFGTGNTLAILDAVSVNTPVNLGPDHTLNMTNGTSLNGGVFFEDGGLLELDQPFNPSDLPPMNGQHGTLRIFNSMNLGTSTWTIPAALDAIELNRFSQGGSTDPAIVIENGRIEGVPNQFINIPGSYATEVPVLKNLTLAVDLNLLDTYAFAEIQSRVILDNATIHIMTGPSKDTLQSLIRHGELRIAADGHLLGQGTIRFEEGFPAGQGGLTTLTNQLTITEGITVLSADGRGFVGTDTGVTLNLGTLRAEGRDDGRSGLTIAGTGLIHQGTLEVTPGGWIEVKETATLAGELVLDYAGLTNLNEGDTFPILTASAIVGGFDELSYYLPAGLEGTNLGLALIYDATTIHARITLLGDLNADGFVGIDDLNRILLTWNQHVTPGNFYAGDPSGDGFVGIDDLTAVLSNWNASAPPPAFPINTPEPGMLAATALGISVIALRRKY